MYDLFTHKRIGDVSVSHLGGHFQGQQRATRLLSVGLSALAQLTNGAAEPRTRRLCPCCFKWSQMRMCTCMHD